MRTSHFKDSHFKEQYGPYALVVGASHGLGAAYAEAIARRGLGLILVARQEAGLESTAGRLRDAYGVDVLTIAADASDFASLERSVDDLKVTVGLLVYNAAFAPIGPFEDTSEERLSLAVAVNVMAPLQLTRHFCAPMISRRRGGIILMSSLAGSQGSPNISTYAATKSFNAILAEGLWKELGPHGVDVLACCAGAILTPGYQDAEQNKPAPGTLEARDVAERTLDALGKGPIVIPGATNKVGRFVMTRLLSRRAAINIMSKNTSGLS